MVFRNAEDKNVTITLVQNLVSIDPTSFDKINVIIDDKFIHSLDQLPVPYIWKEVWLHYTDLHLDVSFS
jgi:hypothetical protein